MQWARAALVVLGIVLEIFVSTKALATAPAGPKTWPAWQQFQAQFVSADGRVIDQGSAAHITTSEGQAYGMFFALVANDRAGFERLLTWTTGNLAGGDLATRLPAWQWGQRADGTWGVIDSTPASDADLWMAYTLAEAGRLWKHPPYARLSCALAARIVEEETAVLPLLGHVMLPGPKAFYLPDGVVRLNPSYTPIQLLRRMATLYPESSWNQITSGSISLLRRSADKGYFPDWVLYKEQAGFMPDVEKRGVGGYDAIRVYLWAGMLDKSDPMRAELIKKSDAIIQHIVQQGVPPLEADTVNGTVHGYGPIGFSSALLPLLAAYDRKPLLQQQYLRVVNAAPLERSNNYYEQVLTLFSLGWLERWYQFDAGGALQPAWLYPQSRQ